MTTTLPTLFSLSLKQGRRAVNRMLLAMSLGFALPLLLPLIVGQFVSLPRGPGLAIAMLLNFALGLAPMLFYTIMFYRRDHRAAGGACRRYVVPGSSLAVVAMIGTMIWGLMTLICVAELIVVANT